MKRLISAAALSVYTLSTATLFGFLIIVLGIPWYIIDHAYTALLNAAQASARFGIRWADTLE